MRRRLMSKQNKMVKLNGDVGSSGVSVQESRVGFVSRSTPQGRRGADVIRLACERVCDSEWKEATSTSPAQPGVMNNHKRSLCCLVCCRIMSQEPKIHLGMTVIVVELGAKEMARTVVQHKVKKKKVGEAQSGFSVFLIQQNWSFL